ncbi:high mobility group box domain-containing protein, partial [Blakeslea trispora]
MRQHFTNPLPSFDQIHKFQPKERTKKIPRPLNSFMIFRLQSQKEIIRQCPGANHRDISKIISKWWKELSAKEKQAYKDQADKLKAEHHLMYPDYKFCP